MTNLSLHVAASKDGRRPESALCGAKILPKASRTSAGKLGTTTPFNHPAACQGCFESYQIRDSTGQLDLYLQAG